MRMIIGIAGKARTGKDTVAKYLFANYSFTRIAFADPVKQAAQVIFGLTNEQTWDDAHKEVVIPYWGKSPRQMFQLVGTECVKPHFGEDIWVKRLAMVADILGTDDIVIPDVRFEAEAAWIRQNGGYIVHLERPGAMTVSSHVSEAGIKFEPGDHIMTNDSSIKRLHDRVDTYIQFLLDRSK